MNAYKLFEVRDESTLIPIMAVQTTRCPLFRRAGYDQPEVILTNLNNQRSSHDPYSWSRTLCEAHKFIRNVWETLEDGQVIDVQFILGETKKPKQSECV